MSYDGIVTMAIGLELKDRLVMGKIEKIYQPQPEQLRLSIHTKQGKYLLLLSAAGNHPAAYLISQGGENPVTPPTFCMAMRKHLSAARIVDISQPDGERILHFDMETLDEMGFSVNRRLVVEIMGKHSNILLLDMASGKIIDSIKHVSFDSSRVRQVLPGIEYTAPPAQDKIPFSSISRDQFRALFSDDLRPEKAIMDGISGLSPVIAQCIAAGGEQEPASFDPDKAYDELRRIVVSLEAGSFEPVVYLDEDDRPADFHAVPLRLYEEDAGFRSLGFDHISQACEYFYSHRESSNIVRQKAADLSRITKSSLDKMGLKLQRLEEDRAKAEDSDRFRLYGELLTANLHQVAPGSKKVTVTSYYDGNEVEIPLDPRFSPSRNAQQYYKKYAKAKTAVREKAVQIEETTEDIKYLESVSAFIDQAQSIEELDLIRQELTENGYIRQRKTKKQSSRAKSRPSPHSYTLSSGLTCLAGRNNKENDWLTTKRASGSDLWFHTKDIPGSHVVLLLDGKKATEEDLAEAASIAAFHSKGNASSNVPVDYTLIRHVKKPSGAKPGMVIFTHNKTLYVDPGIPGALSD